MIFQYFIPFYTESYISYPFMDYTVFFAEVILN